MKNTTKNVVVTNKTQREYGSLTITKNLVQPDGFSYAGADFTGTLHILSGGLALNASFGDTTGNTAQLIVDPGTSMTGTGTFQGSATVLGMLSPGNSPGTLTFGADLTLGGSTILDYELGRSGTVADSSSCVRR